jgi:large subunit ribosomal protein L4
MATLNLEVKNLDGEKVGSAKLAATVFSVAPNIHVMHEVCRAQMAAARQGTHNTKTRGQVSGGGKKPFRQKGTGRARQGTIRAPHYAGGGVVFGPHPRSYAFKVNRREVKLALRSALSAKFAEGVIILLENVDFEKPSTKTAAAVLDKLGINGRVTIVVADDDINAFLSFRNIPRVRIIAVSEMNTYDFIDNKQLLLTKAALARIEEVLA